MTNDAKNLARYIFENLANDIDRRVKFLREIKTESEELYDAVEKEISRLGKEALDKMLNS